LPCICTCLASAAVAVLISTLGLGLFCRHQVNPRVSQALPVIDKHLNGNRYYYWYNLPHQRSEGLMDSCKAQMTETFPIRNLEFGSVPAAEGVRLAYNCTKVPGLFEKVPEALRGVFWMKGNAIGEELAILQNGQWFEEERTYIAPFAPFMWAWAGGKPQEAPFWGHFYGTEDIHTAAYSMSALGVGYSFTFKECPGSPSLPPPFGVPGSHCEKGAGATDLRYASLQSHVMGDLTAISQEDEYTIEEMPSGVESGSLWYRGIFGGPSWMGRCRCISVGSYQLTKIIDGDGRPLEPYYSEFIHYMGSLPLIFWTGYADRGDVQGEESGLGEMTSQG